MTEDDCISRYPLPCPAEHREEICRLLEEQTLAERRAQGLGDTLVMRYLCACLFSMADAELALPIWRAKGASMDAFSSIDTEFLLGAGKAETMLFLRAHQSTDAQAALEHLEKSDLVDFSVSGKLGELQGYYMP